jgi:Zn-dependent M32 family carboxypeptidase
MIINHKKLKKTIIQKKQLKLKINNILKKINKFLIFSKYLLRLMNLNKNNIYLLKNKNEIKENILNRMKYNNNKQTINKQNIKKEIKKTIKNKYTKQTLKSTNTLIPKIQSKKINQNIFKKVNNNNNTYSYTTIGGAADVQESLITNDIKSFNLSFSIDSDKKKKKKKKRN